MKKKSLYFTIVSFIIGFMLFVQYNTTQHVEIENTKDVLEIRNELAGEQQKHTNLLKSIERSKEVIKQYDVNNKQASEQLLEQTLIDIQDNLGANKVSGPGFQIHIKPADELIEFGYEVEEISSLLMLRFVNELNRNGALYMQINNERISFWSSIRDINGKTTINGHPIGTADIEIKVISHDEKSAQKLYNYLLASSLIDEFYIDNYQLEASSVQNDVEITATYDLTQPSYLEAVE